MELALARRVGRDLIVLLGLVLMDCLGQNACQYVSATLITQTCVTPGQENVNASLAGMGLCAYDPAPFTRMERDAATTAIVRMMHNVPLSTERASVQQDIGAQTAVSCVQRAHLVRTVLRNVTARMVPSAPVRMVVAIARQVGKGSSATDLAMRNSTAGIVAHRAGASTTQRATPRMGHAPVHQATWVSCVNGSASQDGLDWSAASCVTAMMTTALSVTL